MVAKYIRGNLDKACNLAIGAIKSSDHIYRINIEIFYRSGSQLKQEFSNVSRELEAVFFLDSGQPLWRIGYSWLIEIFFCPTEDDASLPTL